MKDKKRRNRAALLRRLGLGVFAALFVCAAAALIWTTGKLRAQRETLDALAQSVAERREESLCEAPDDPDVPEVPEADPEEAEPQILYDYAALYAENNDLMGWLTIPGTVVDYPVMQTPDDPEYYLRTDFYHEHSSGGMLFMDALCRWQTPSDNLIIYGHNMRDGAMFATLPDYADPDFLADHGVIRLDTLYERHEYQVMAVFRMRVLRQDESGFRYYTFTDALSPEDFDTYVRTVKELSLFDTGVSAEYGDKLLTLSTCSYHITNGRFVVVAKQVT